MAGKKELMAGVSHTIKPKNSQVQDRKPFNRRCEFRKISHIKSGENAGGGRKNEQ
jgi:hypothetical protein